MPDKKEVSPPDFRHLNVSYCDAPFDISSLLLGYLERAYQLSVNSAYQIVQSWLCDNYALTYSTESKLGVERACRSIHLLLYGNSIITPAQGRQLTSGIIDLPMFIHAIAAAMQQAPGLVGNESPDVTRQAIGLFMFLRMSRLVRLRSRWGLTFPMTSPTAQSLEKKIYPREQCVSLRCAFDTTYILARIFGAVSNIPGLDFAFRGGILPSPDHGLAMTIFGRPGSGKTLLGLELAADFAARGGVAIYLTLEESVSSILARVTTFDLNSNIGVDVLASSNLTKAELRKSLGTNRAGRGVLLIHRIDGHQTVPLKATLDELDEVLGTTWPCKALVIDSLGSLYFDDVQPSRTYEGVSREQLERLVSYMESQRYFGIFIAEGDETDSALAGVSSVVVHLGFDDTWSSRTFEIHKCRNQHYHQGRHDMRIRDGRGMKIYPSLSSVRASSRMRPKAQPSQVRGIELNLDINQPPAVVREKSTALVVGGAGSGKTAFVAQWLAAPTVAIGKEESSAFRPVPKGVLVLTFRTSENLYRSHMEFHYRHLIRPLNKNAHVANRSFRWFSPGDNLSAGQLLGIIWDYMQAGRRRGAPIERIVFDEIEAIDDSLTRVSQEGLFWQSLFELVRTEPVSALFALRHHGGPDNCKHALVSSVDYLFMAELMGDRPLIKCVREPAWQTETKEINAEHAQS